MNMTNLMIAILIGSALVPLVILAVVFGLQKLGIDIN